MAVLGILLCLLAAPTFAATPMSQTEALGKSAFLLLEQGDTVRAKKMAERLERVDPQVAALYRLEWIASTIQSKRAKQEDEDLQSDQLKWKPSSEIWQDEWAAYAKRGRSRDVREEFYATEVEQSAIGSVLKSAVKRGEKLRTAVDKALVTYAFNEFNMGREVQGWISKVGTSQNCQWKAARELQKTENANWLAWKAECSACEGEFCAAANLRLADQYTENAEYEPALRIYQAIGRNLKQVPLALQYRVLALQVLTEKPLENLLRAAGPVFEATAGEAFSEVQVSAVKGYLCSLMAEQSPASLSRVFIDVYSRKTWIRQVRPWIATCSVREAMQISRISQIKGLDAYQRESILSAKELRLAQEKRQQRRLIEEAKRLRSVGELRAQATELQGVMEVPVLFPFAPVKMEASPYRIGRVYSETL